MTTSLFVCHFLSHNFNGNRASTIYRCNPSSIQTRRHPHGCSATSTRHPRRAIATSNAICNVPRATHTSIWHATRRREHMPATTGSHTRNDQPRSDRIIHSHPHQGAGKATITTTQNRRRHAQTHTFTVCYNRNKPCGKDRQQQRTDAIRCKRADLICRRYVAP